MRFQELVERWSEKFYSENDPDENFLTLPKITDLLALSVLSWIKRNTLHVKKTRAHLTILELGAGDGELAYSLVKLSDTLGIKINRITLVESSPIRVKNILRKFKKCEDIQIVVTEDLEELPKPLMDSDVVIANEFFDSLPFSVIRKTGDSYEELVIKDGVPTFEQISEASMRYIKENIPADGLSILESNGEDQIVFEICDGFPKYVSRISKIGKTAIISDYGYRHFRHRTPNGSVILHWKYRAEKMDFFDLSKLKMQISEGFGRKDISFFVDFDVLQSLFEREGFEARVQGLSSFVIENLEGLETDIAALIFSKDRVKGALELVDVLTNWGNFFVLTATRQTPSFELSKEF